MSVTNDRSPGQNYYSKPASLPSKSELGAESYYKQYPRLQAYKNESNFKDAGNNFTGKPLEEPMNPPNNEPYQMNYKQNAPPKYEDENYPSYNDPKYQNLYRDQKYPPQAYEDPKYEDQYYQNKSLEPNYPNPSQNPNENLYQKYQENNYQKYNEPVINEYSGVERNIAQEKNQGLNNYTDEKPQEDQENKYEEPKYPEYADEIEKLKDELRRKEEELNAYQQSLIANAGNQPKEPEEQSIYSRINKTLFDKQRLEEQKKYNSMTLDYQISEKSKARSLEIMEKEREQSMRLEMLKKIRDDEARERYEKMLRAKEYRDQLEVQSLVKSNMNYQEKLQLKSDVPRPNESPPRISELEPRSYNSQQNLSYSPATQKFTKKTPKTMCYNPITGVLRDTSQYVIGSFPSYNVKDPSITYHKNQSKVPEIASHPAFYQQKYTKNHPKVVPSFPVTGINGQALYNNEWKGEGELRLQEEEQFKQGDKHMAEYGSLMMQKRNPTYN